MSARIKNSIFILLAITVSVCLYVSFGDEDSGALGPYPIGAPLMRAAARIPEGAAGDSRGASENAYFSPAASLSPDENCKQDEDRLAELQAKPSLDEGVHLAVELRCRKLWPQLVAVMDSLTHTAGSAGASVSNGATPYTMSAGGAAPSLALSSPEMEATSATLDDHCKQDEDRLAELQAKPSFDEAIRFEGELKCSMLLPQLLAMIKVMIDPPHSNESSDVTASALVAEGRPDPAERTETPPEANVASDEVCKRDEERLARLGDSRSSDEAIRFANELSCEKLRPRLLALTGDLANALKPDSVSVSKVAGAGAGATNEAPPASQAAMDADRRITALEQERDTLAAEVGRLERDRDSTSPEQAGPPTSPQPAIPAERADPEPSPASASLPDGMPARVLIRYLRNDARARQQAENLANALTGQGVEVADLRESAGAVRTGLSFSYAPDEAAALRVGRLAGIAPVRRRQPKDGLMAPPGTVELSLAGDTPSRKESNHE